MDVVIGERGCADSVVSGLDEADTARQRRLGECVCTFGSMQQAKLRSIDERDRAAMARMAKLNEASHEENSIARRSVG
jgi:hypothetical protein